ncbi:MAG: aminotransferase class III-fold pyridoxal phosphate-dependent enzyme [Candidatus Rokubacteria bacterium]|nr:aminotransferase class III-fold pyridoxal phosphate-dependent enzyme [Candidatus Rokubacteria bacterium]
MGRQEELLELAYRYLPGAAFGAFAFPEGAEVVVAGGRGSKVWDVEGREYIDYILGSGPMILGHAHPAVVRAVQEQIAQGSSFYALNEAAIRLAEKIVRACPCAEAVKFAGTGSEATYFALRLARAATGREEVVKFEGGYHGHHDYSMADESAGIPRGARSSVLVAPFNDLAGTAAVIEEQADDIAAVIVEPLQRVIPPAPGFLEGLRALTSRHGILLVFDEVVTGFRLAYGGAQQFYGVVPDLACYGKIIGGGLPLAAVAGRRDILDLANPRRRGTKEYAWVSGTFSGNPLGAVAGLAVLSELEKPGAYQRLHAIGDRLRAGLGEIFRRRGVSAQVLGVGPLANVYSSPEPICDYRSLRRADMRLTQGLWVELIRRGVMTNLPAKLYLSLAHTDDDIDRTLAMFDESLRAVLDGVGIREATGTRTGSGTSPSAVRGG